MEIKRNLSDDVEVGARPPVQNVGGGDSCFQLRRHAPFSIIRDGEQISVPLTGQHKKGPDH